MGKEIITGNNYIQCLNEIKERIKKSQYDALKAVNKELINLYWDLGQIIIEKQKEYSWGKSIVENLAHDLQKEYAGIRGFSSRNLWNMRNFYMLYEKNEKLQPLVAEISWVKNVIIMEKCKDGLEREFYIKMTKKFGWTKDVLINQIENKAFEKFAINQTNFDKTLPTKYQGQAKLAVKDEYTFDFLELGEEYSEKELERALMDKIRKFLIEMGDYFCFIGNQYRVVIDDKEYFIDLLLYHRKLKCLIAIELKIGEFIPEHIGKMQFYLSMLDHKKRLDGENPTIGIIICKNKSRTTVEYALKEGKKPIGVATYKIMDKLPKDISRYLPSPKELADKLKELD